MSTALWVPDMDLKNLLVDCLEGSASRSTAIEVAKFYAQYVYAEDTDVIGANLTHTRSPWIASGLDTLTILTSELCDSRGPAFGGA